MHDGYGVCNGAHADPNQAQKKLVDEVLMRMEQGWIPQGGIAHIVVPTSPSATHMYTQAVVKTKAE